MKFIDSFLNRITMYRLVLYYLLALLAFAMVLGVFHILPYSPVALLVSALVFVVSAWLTNKAFAFTFNTVPGSDSVYITALILALIVPPVALTDGSGLLFLAVLGMWAVASKYLLALGGKHIFNPAAFSVALAALLLSHGATWWIAGNLVLMPIVVIGGLLIVRKIHRFDLVLAFTLASFTTIALTSSGSSLSAIWQTLLHSSFFFLAFVMLTEPATMPPTRWLRVAYGVIVGIWFAPNVHIGSFYLTPELALLIGNVFVYFVSPKGRLMLTLKSNTEIASGVHEFVFTPNRKLSFLPGQYLEWTIGKVRFNNRGNRRYFTIASSPTEKDLRLGVKFYKPMSAFKESLMALKPGDTISAGQLAGDFTLPKNKKQKLVFIAGGIGVTPFRSMVQYLLDTKDTRPVTLLYSNKLAEEIAYIDTFERARTELGMKTVYALTNEKAPVDGAYMGMLDAKLIQSEVPDYKERTFYISGPQGMVDAFKTTLHEMGVPRRRIKSDYFPGFA